METKTETTTTTTTEEKALSHQDIQKQFGTSSQKKTTHETIQQVYGSQKRRGSELTHQQIAELLGGKLNRQTPTHQEIANQYGVYQKAAQEHKKMILEQIIRVTTTPLADDGIDEFVKYVEETETPMVQAARKKGTLVSFRRKIDKANKMTYTHEVYPGADTERVPLVELPEVGYDESKSKFFADDESKYMIQLWGEGIEEVSEEEKKWAANVQVFTKFDSVVA